MGLPTARQTSRAAARDRSSSSPEMNDHSPPRTTVANSPPGLLLATRWAWAAAATNAVAPDSLRVARPHANAREYNRARPPTLCRSSPRTCPRPRECTPARGLSHGEARAPSDTGRFTGRRTAFTVG